MADNCAGVTEVDGGRTIGPEPLESGAFVEFLDVIEIGDIAGHQINQGMCMRYPDLARLDFGSGGRAGISLFRARLRQLPHRMELMERHPFGSQAFIPMGDSSFLVVVAPDEGGKPGPPRATVIGGGQGVNILRNTWHGVLTPLSGSGLFAVIDWIGEEPNLIEHWFETPFTVRA